MARHSAPRESLGVNAYSEQWLRRGFPWVYRDEIVRAPRALQPGAVVGLTGPSGAALGVGIWDDAHVAVRRFREDDGAIDADLLGARLVAALARRVLPPQTTAWRWVHGENDDLPGVRVDVWGGSLGVALDSPALLPLLQPLLGEVASRWPDPARPLEQAWLSWRLEEGRSDKGLPRGLVQTWAAAEDEVWVQERGLWYAVRPQDGFDAGLYCDMREARTWMAPWWTDKKVLNTFCFTGAYSVAAAAGGAAEVVSVDLSGPSLARARANLLRNGLPEGRLWEEDVFRALDRLRRTGERFDVVVADPPSFSRGADGSWSASQDLGKLVASCLRVLRPGGWLIAASNNGKVSPKAFQEQLQEGARRAERRLRILHQCSQPPDFPAALHFPESRYLKCWIVEAT